MPPTERIRSGPPSGRTWEGANDALSTQMEPVNSSFILQRLTRQSQYLENPNREKSANKKRRFHAAGQSVHLPELEPGTSSRACPSPAIQPGRSAGASCNPWTMSSPITAYLGPVGKPRRRCSTNCQSFSFSWSLTRTGSFQTVPGVNNPSIIDSGSHVANTCKSAAPTPANALRVWLVSSTGDSRSSNGSPAPGLR